MKTTNLLTLLVVSVATLTLPGTWSYADTLYGRCQDYDAHCSVEESDDNNPGMNAIKESACASLLRECVMDVLQGGGAVGNDVVKHKETCHEKRAKCETLVKIQHSICQLNPFINSKDCDAPYEDNLDRCKEGYAACQESAQIDGLHSEVLRVRHQTRINNIRKLRLN
jgi:hypothetical protein